MHLLENPTSGSNPIEFAGVSRLCLSQVHLSCSAPSYLERSVIIGFDLTPKNDETTSYTTLTLQVGLKEMTITISGGTAPPYACTFDSKRQQPRLPWAFVQPVDDKGVPFSTKCARLGATHVTDGLLRWGDIQADDPLSLLETAEATLRNLLFYDGLGAQYNPDGMLVMALSHCGLQIQFVGAFTRVHANCRLAFYMSNTKNACKRIDKFVADEYRQEEDKGKHTSPPFGDKTLDGPWYLYHGKFHCFRDQQVPVIECDSMRWPDVVDFVNDQVLATARLQKDHAMLFEIKDDKERDVEVLKLEQQQQHWTVCDEERTISSGRRRAPKKKDEISTRQAELAMRTDRSFRVYEKFVDQRKKRLREELQDDGSDETRATKKATAHS